MPMHVVVVGCGRVGSSLALDLIADGHSVAIIDKNPNAFRRFLPAGWGGNEIVGFGFDRDHLIEAGADRAGGLAAVTSGDNSNILTARIARETFQIRAVVARIYDPRRAEIYQRLGIPTVASATWTIEQVRRGLFPERSVSEWTDPTGGVELVAAHHPARLVRATHRRRSSPRAAHTSSPSTAAATCSSVPASSSARRATSSTSPWQSPIAEKLFSVLGEEVESATAPDETAGVR